MEIEYSMAGDSFGAQNETTFVSQNLNIFNNMTFDIGLYVEE